MTACTTTRDGYTCERKGKHEDCETVAPAYAEGQRATVDGRIALVEAECAVLRERVRVLEAQVRSLQMGAPRRIPDLAGRR